VSIKGRLYSGFDTEYNTEEFGVVSVISYQLSIYGRLIINVKGDKHYNPVERLEVLGDESIIDYAIIKTTGVQILCSNLYQNVYYLKNEIESTELKDFIRFLGFLTEQKQISKSSNDKLNLDTYFLPLQDAPNHKEFFELSNKPTLNDVLYNTKKIGVEFLDED